MQWQRDKLKLLNQCLHSLMLCVEAKFKGNLESAYGQLVTYLACLRNRVSIEESPIHQSLVQLRTASHTSSYPSHMKVSCASASSLMLWRRTCQLSWDVCGTFWIKQLRCHQSHPQRQVCKRRIRRLIMTSMKNLISTMILTWKAKKTTMMCVHMKWYDWGLPTYQIVEIM